MSIDVGARLRSVRITFSLSQRELARRAGVTNGLDLSAAPQAFFGADELVELGNAEVSLRLVAAQRAGRQLTLLHQRYAAGAATSEEMLAHRGEQGGVVVRGRIELTVGGATRVLGPGEAYYFASQLPHRFRNVGREACEIISACTPPTF